MGKISRKAKMKKFHKIESLRFEGGKLILRVDGRTYTLDLADVSEKLLSANESERKQFVISPSGYGIHWPFIDEDLSIDGLIKSGSRAHRVKMKARSVRKSAV